MKLIFLDIDGVLNRLEFNPQAASHTLCRECVVAFNRVLLATDARVVVSSSWRYMVHGGGMTVKGFDYLLRTHGVVADRLIGVTRPDFAETREWEPRYQQIADWIVENGSGSIERYCILDDESDAFGGRPGVQTAGGVGLTEKDADEAIEILTSPRRC